MHPAHEATQRRLRSRPWYREPGEATPTAAPAPLAAPAPVELPVEFAPGGAALAWSATIEPPARATPTPPTPPRSALEGFERRRDGVMADALLRQAGAVLANPDGDTQHARGLVAEAERLATPAAVRPPAMTPERRRELLSLTPDGRALLADEDRARALVEPGR